MAVIPPGSVGSQPVVSPSFFSGKQGSNYYSSSSCPSFSPVCVLFAADKCFVNKRLLFYPTAAYATYARSHIQEPPEESERTPLLGNETV